jgi:hypothetical protein
MAFTAMFAAALAAIETTNLNLSLDSPSALTIAHALFADTEFHIHSGVLNHVYLVL